MKARKSEPGARRPAVADPAASTRSAAEQSALTALQAELDGERIANLSARTRLQQDNEALRQLIAELQADGARLAARIRELEAQLQARSR